MERDCISVTLSAKKKKKLKNLEKKTQQHYLLEIMTCFTQDNQQSSAVSTHVGTIFFLFEKAYVQFT